MAEKDITEKVLESYSGNGSLYLQKWQKADGRPNNCKTPLEERTKTFQVAKTFKKYAVSHGKEYK